MASEEQCLSEPLNNVTDEAESKDSSQHTYSDDLERLEEFLNSSQPEKLHEFHSDDEASFSVSDNVIVTDSLSGDFIVQQDDNSDNSKDYDKLGENIDSCIDIASTTRSFGGWCESTFHHLQILPVGELASVMPQGSHDEILEIIDLENVDSVCLTPAEDRLSSVSPTKDSGSTTKDSVSPTKDSESPTKDSESPTKNSVSPTKDSESSTKNSDFPNKDSESPTKDSESPDDPELESSILLLKEYVLSDAVLLASISSDLAEENFDGKAEDVLLNVIDQINCLDSIKSVHKQCEVRLDDVIDASRNDSSQSSDAALELFTSKVEVVDPENSSSVCIKGNAEITNLSSQCMDIINVVEYLQYDKYKLLECAEEKLPVGVEEPFTPSPVDLNQTTNATVSEAQIHDEDFLLLKIDVSNSSSGSGDLIDLTDEKCEKVAQHASSEVQESKTLSNKKVLGNVDSFIMAVSNDGIVVDGDSQVQSEAEDAKIAEVKDVVTPNDDEFCMQASCTNEIHSEVPVANEKCPNTSVSEENNSMTPTVDENDEQNFLALSIPVSLPTISEKSDDVEDTSAIGTFEDMEFNLQNSPMLRRSRQTNEDKTRRDCRFIFGADDGSDDSDGTPTSQKSFTALRDSLDIAKHAHLFDTSNDDLKSDDVKETDGNSNVEQTPEATTSEWKAPPYQSSHPSKPLLPHKTKKTSIKSDREKDSSRRVSFPEDDSRLITSYLEPVNPWYHMSEVSTDIISEAYKRSCERHKTRALPAVLQQIIALPVDVGGRIECLSIRNHKLDAGHCECLEEIFRRVQFHTVDFEACELDDESAIPLFDMIEFYDSALQLNISQNCKIGNRGWQACARMMKRTPSLRILEARNTNLSEQNMPIICKALRCGTRLHTLHLENCNLTGRPLVSLVGALRLNDTITDLYLADNRLGANDSIQLGNLVRANSTLKLLDLRNNNIQDSGCAHICKDIAEQQSLRSSKGTTDQGEDNSGLSQVGLSTLVLWNNHITVHAVPYFSLMLQFNTTLETLNLGRNNLTSEGVFHLKNSLLRNKCLKRLGLQATRIGNEGAVALAECIADNNVISRIDLRENSIQVAGLLALSRSLKINSTVVQLDLDANPRAEPSSELSEQHLILHHEIKSLCQRNQTNDHLKNATQTRERNEPTKNLLLLSPEKRKISLTCDSPNKNQEEKAATETVCVSECKKYRSPAPSPSVSPCPSPSLSPSPSPVPSPLKNRFKVCRVTEESGTAFSSSFEISNPHAGSILSTSAPAFLMHSMSGSLPSLVPSTRPNRFTGGGRFTVTKVQESSSSAAFKSSLPCNRAMSSPSLIALSERSEDAASAPTIVVSSPNKAVRGFSVTTSEEDVSCGGPNHELKRNSSLDLPSTTNQNRSSSSDSSPQDDVFVEGAPPSHSRTLVGLRSINSTISQSFTNTITTYTDDRLSPTPTPMMTQNIQRAPLASIEAGSFDSDSEDSELATQSSDSTHSDEVKIATEPSATPLVAWEDKGSDVEGVLSHKKKDSVFVNKD